MKSLLLLLGLSLFSALGFTQDCAPITISGGAGQINITGISGAPIAGVQVFNSSWASVYNQTYPNPAGSITVSPMTAGNYFVNVRLYNSSWGVICEKGVNVTVSDVAPPPPSDVCGATFQKTFGLAAGNDEATDIVKASDGGYIAVGNSATTGSTGYSALVMKFNNQGNLLWSKTMGGAQEDFFSIVVATPDGGCLAGGQINSTGYGAYSGDTWLVRFDGNGNVLWQKRYFVSGSPGNIHAMIATSDGGFALTGTFPFTPGASDWMVLKLDANGNIQWQKKLGSSSSDSGTGIIEDDHGGNGLIVSGIVYSSSWYDAIITKLDFTTGNLVWTKSYDFDSRANWTGTLQKVSDGIIFNTITAQGYGSENARPGILKTDFNGNIIWVKDFTIPNCRDGRTVVLPDGGFMMVQSELPHDAASDLYMMRIDATGAIMWTKKYPAAGAQWLNGIISDGNYVVGAGLATTGAYNDVLLGKADLNGKFGSCTSQTVTGTTRNCVVTTLSFNWPVNTALNLTAANTTATATAINPVQNVVCADVCPDVTISNVTVSENAGNAVLQVCISSPAANALVYQYNTANGTAQSGSDFTGGTGTVTIAAGQTCGTITIPILNDANVEQEENFTVSIGSVSANVTITDDDQVPAYCAAVTITPGSNVITVTGVSAPIVSVQVFNGSWATVFNQTYTNSPGTVNVPIAPGTYLVKVSFYTANWGYICDKSENVTVINQCPAGTICISNICPSQTVNLNNAYSVANLPAGTTVTWHTGTPATDANKMTDAQAQNVSASGTYYAAINIGGGGCYSATISVTVTIVACTPASAKAITVNAESTDQPATRNITVFPNPFTNSLRVIIDSEKKERATIALMDVRGKELKQLPMNLQHGSNTVLLEGLEQYPSGNYFLRITSESGVRTLKVMRQQ